MRESVTNSIQSDSIILSHPNPPIHFELPPLRPSSSICSIEWIMNIVASNQSYRIKPNQTTMKGRIECIRLLPFLFPWHSTPLLVSSLLFVLFLFLSFSFCSRSRMIFTIRFQEYLHALHHPAIQEVTSFSFPPLPLTCPTLPPYLPSLPSSSPVHSFPSPSPYCITFLVL